MSPFTLTAILILLVLVTAVLPYFVGRRVIRRKRLEARVRSKALWSGLDIATAAKEVAKEDGDKYWATTGGEKLYHFDKEGRKIDTDTGEFVYDKTFEPERKLGKSPLLAAPYGRKQSFFLTAAQLEAVNTKRKLIGRRPLNRDGFANAVAVASGERRQPTTNNDWLTYLIMYECLFADHSSATTRVDTGISITPDAPYNGHGGDFAGAGASGDWTSPGAYTLGAADLTMGVAAAVENNISTADPVDNVGKDYSAPVVDPSYTPEPAPAIDPAPYSAPDPAPSYSAPDPSPSYTSDTSSSSSYDSGSSSSYDSGSSGGGGDGS